MTSRMPSTSVRPTAMSAYTTPMVTPFTTCCRKRAVTLRAWAASREAEIVHRPPVGDRDRVELEVQLLAQIEGHLLGTLRFDDPAVLAEDDVLELLEHAVRLVHVVVLADETVPSAAIAGQGLRDEEIEELFARTPVHVDDDRVRQVQLVTRVADRLLAVLVREQRILGSAL